MYEKIKLWENASDNLLYTEMTESGLLDLRVARMKYDNHFNGNVVMPISSTDLKEIKQVAIKNRDTQIAMLKKIR
jgi:hypothetical protein